MAARKQPVPVAENQMNGNLAPSGVGLGTTGLSREILRCSGVLHPPFGFPSAVIQAGVVRPFISAFIRLGTPTKTETGRIRRGRPALRNWRVVPATPWGSAARAARHAPAAA